MSSHRVVHVVLVLRLAAVAAAVAGCVSSIVACGKQPVKQSTTALLDDATAARVGDQVVSLHTVERIALARNSEPRAALDLAVEDALLAARAQSELPPHAPAAHLERLALARALLEEVATRERARGPVTQAELTAAIDHHWWDIDRPELSRTTHAVVLVDKAASEEERARAIKLAETIRAAVIGSVDSKAFKDRVNAIDAAGLKVKVEDLAPVGADGRVVDPYQPPKPGERTARYSAPYAQAAAAIKELGEISPVVQTPFGHHVIMLTERLPPLRATQAQLEAEAFEHRASKALSELVASLRASSNVVVLDQALALTGLIQVVQ